MSDLIAFGRHKARLDGHIVLVWFNGDFVMEDWEVLRKLAEQALESHGRIYMIGYAEHAGSVVAAVRSSFVNWTRSHRLLGFANVKVNFIGRALAVLMGNAVRLIAGISMPIGFFEDEAKARAWIAELDARQK